MYCFVPLTTGGDDDDDDDDAIIQYFIVVVIIININLHLFFLIFILYIFFLCAGTAGIEKREITRQDYEKSKAMIYPHNYILFFLFFPPSFTSMFIFVMNY